MQLDDGPVTVEDLLPLAMTNLGHFTSMRVEPDRSVRGFALHLDRLARDCRITFDAELDRDLVRDRVRNAIDSATAPMTLRVTIYDPNLTLGTIGAPAHPRVLVTTTPVAATVPAPLRVKTYPFTRDVPGVKHIGLWSQMHRRRQARLDGYDDALFVEPDNTVSEGATWTAGFVDADGRVIWPDAPVLISTTVQLLERVHNTRTAVVKVDDLPHMQAAFASNISSPVRPIVQIDDHKYPHEHPILDTLRQAYESIPGEQV